jgi:hypothetical protein
MSSPNVCEMMHAIRGQPNRELRDLSSTMARMSASLGPFGPGFFGRSIKSQPRAAEDTSVEQESALQATAYGKRSLLRSSARRASP